jgi:hypothetical protein
MVFLSIFKENASIVASFRNTTMLLHVASSMKRLVAVTCCLVSEVKKVKTARAATRTDETKNSFRSSVVKFLGKRPL